MLRRDTAINILLVAMIVVKWGQAFKVQIRYMHIFDHNVDEQWERYALLFPSNHQTIKQLYIQSAVLSEKGLDKILSYDLSQLEVLQVSQTDLTPAMFKKIAQQPFFLKLRKLVLEKANLVGQDFKHLRKSGAVSWQILGLNSNYINAQGFYYLSQLSMNLTGLLVCENSLVEDQAVDSIIRMNLSHLQYGCFRQTSISSSNMLKILRATNTSKLINLTMGIYTYPIQFFEEVTQMDFSSLKNLGLVHMLLESSVVPVLKNWRLPSIQVLQLTGNHFLTQDFRKFLTHQNYPKLRSLDMKLNFIDEEIIDHFISEGFQFKELDMLTFSVQSSVFRYLLNLDCSSLETLYLPYLHVIGNDLNHFIEQANLSAIRVLDLEYLTNTGDILQQIMDKTLPEVEQLTLGKVGNLKLDIRTNALPQLKELIADFSVTKLDEIVNFITNCKKIAPKLEKLKMGIWITDIEEIRQLLLSPTMRHFDTQIYIQIVLKQSIIKSDSEIFDLTIRTQPQGQTKIIQFNSKSIIHEVQVDERYKVSDIISEMDLSELKHLRLFGTCPFLDLVKGSKTMFSNLTQIYGEGITEKCLQKINLFEFPALQLINFQFEQSLKNAVNVQFLKTGVPNLKVITLGRNAPPNFYVSAFCNHSFANLVEIQFKQVQELTSQDLHQIFGAVHNLNRLRVINANYSSLGREPSFLLNPNIFLEGLSLDQNIIGPKFQNFSTMNTEFLVNFSLAGTQINDDNFISFLEAKSAGTGKHAQLFPKLQRLSLASNYITEKSLRKLLEVGVPSIHSLRLEYNSEPEVFNVLFSDPQSKRIISFITNYNSLESIDGSIPPENLRSLAGFSLESSSLRDSDFINLGKFNFYSLKRSIFNLQKIGDCSTLRVLQKIMKRVEVAVMYFSFPLPSLNDDCLPTGEQETSNAVPENLIIYGPGYYTSIRKLTDSFFNPSQYLQTVIIPQAYLSDHKLKQAVLESNLHSIQNLILRHNQLSDSSLHAFFNLSLPNLRRLDLTGNEDLTHRGLQLMKNRDYSALLSLKLSWTSIQDTGLQYLARNEFPELLELELINIGMTGKGITIINTVKASKLKVLDISCNELSVNEISQLNVTLFPELTDIRVYPTLLAEDYQYLLQRLNAQRPQTKQLIVIRTDISYLPNNKNTQ